MPLSKDKKAGCWANRSLLERILIGVIVIGIFTAAILLVFVIKKPYPKQTELPSDVCRTSTCIHEAVNILHRINSNVNPCEDFYHFACGNFVKSTHGDEKLNDFFLMKNKRNRQILELYAEDVRDDEHRIVKSAKNLFRACMNKSEIERDNVKTIKMAIQEIGGWPALLKGSKWNETNFNWLTATYKLRKLGYPFSVFLNLDVKEDVKNKGKYIFKVALPNFDEWSLFSNYSKNDAVGIMTKIATMFGAEDQQFVYKQLDGTYRFWNYLHSHVYYNDAVRITISDLRQKYGKYLNWLDFIRNITGPTVEVSMNDYVLFQNPEAVRSWLEVISSTPKRTLANYVVWKVIEQQLPYLSTSIRNLDTKREEGNEMSNFGSGVESRATYCLLETQKRFIVSPLEIMYSRKYLPYKKRKLVEEIMKNIKSEFVHLLKNTDWMEERDKQVTVAKAEAITLVIGQYGNYFDDKMLDALDVDMVATKTDTFLNLLAQANRNYQTSLYNQIKMSSSKNLLKSNYSKEGLETTVYYPESDMVVVPVVATEGFSFQENGPNYLNYRSIGRIFAVFLDQFLYTFVSKNTDTNKWSNGTMEAIRKMNMEQCKLHESMPEIPFAVGVGLGEKLSYAAYEKLLKLNGEEQKLLGIDYTPRQLFWILSVYCYTDNIYSNSNKMYYFNDLMFGEPVTRGSVSNNYDFARDFGCSVGSRMNPATKCSLW